MKKQESPGFSRGEQVNARVVLVVAAGLTLGIGCAPLASTESWIVSCTAAVILLAMAALIRPRRGGAS